MNLGDVIRKADALYPNKYTLSEKLGWCYDVSCMIRSEIDTQYAFKMTDRANVCDDISGIGANVVQSVLTPTHIYTKSDVLSWFGGDIKLPADITENIQIVYLTMPERYRQEAHITNGTVYHNHMTLDERTEFTDRDTVKIVYDGVIYTCRVVDNTEELILGGADLPDYTGEISIEKIINDPLECGSPYDYMYVDYLLGKISFYQHDYDSYNQQMAQYNAKVMAYQKFAKVRDMYSKSDNFRCFWR